MNYPSQLKVDPQTRATMTMWVNTELTNHLGERDSWIQDMQELQRDYIAKPSKEPNKFPFVGASNIIIPIVAISYEAVLARVSQRYTALKEMLSIAIKDPEAEGIQDELERYFQDEIIVTGDFYDNIIGCVQECLLLGTGVAKATYEKITKTGLRNGKKFEVVIRDGSIIKSVPVTSFLMPFDCKDPQISRWCGEAFFLTPYQVPEYERCGMFEKGTTEKLKQFYLPNSGNTTDILSTIQYDDRLDNRVPNYPQFLTFYMIQCQYCIDEYTDEMKQINAALNIPDDAEQSFPEIVIIYHKESNQIVSITANPYYDLRRDYRTVNYFPLPYRWAGIGIGQQAKIFQEEVSTQHRQIIDAGTLANTRMWKVRKGNTSIKDNEPIFNNKIWWVDDMDDVQAFENNEIYGSALNMENQANIYGQQRTSVNEATLGMPGVGTPGTATESMNRLQEGARKWDYVISNQIRFASQLFKDFVLNTVQYGPNVERLRYSPKGREIEMFLKRPYEDFRKDLIMTISMVDQNNNLMLDRQTMTQLSGAAQQYYNQTFPVIQMMANPQLASQPMVFEAARTIIRGANIVFTRILETYGIRDPQKFLFAVPEPPTPPMNVQNPGIIGSPNVGTPLSLPSTSTTNINLGSGMLPGTIPEGLSGLLGGGY